MAFSLEFQNPLTEERCSMFFKRTDQIQNFKSLKSSFIQNLLLIIIMIIIAIIIIIIIIIIIVVVVYYQIMMANQYSDDVYDFSILNDNIYLHVFSCYDFYYKMGIFCALNIFYDSSFLNNYANSYALNIIAIIFLIISLNPQDYILCIHRYCIR